MRTVWKTDSICTTNIFIFGLSDKVAQPVANLMDCVGYASNPDLTDF